MMSELSRNNTEDEGEVFLREGLEDLGENIIKLLKSLNKTNKTLQKIFNE